MLDFFNKNAVRRFLAGYSEGNQTGGTGMRDNFLEFQSITLDRPGFQIMTYKVGRGNTPTA